MIQITLFLGSVQTTTAIAEPRKPIPNQRYSRSSKRSEELNQHFTIKHRGNIGKINLIFTDVFKVFRYKKTKTQDLTREPKTYSRFQLSEVHSPHPPYRASSPNFGEGWGGVYSI
jgi:hypothetical protein